MARLPRQAAKNEQATLVAALQLEPAHASAPLLVGASLLPALLLARERGARLAVMPAYIGLSLLPTLVRPAPASWAELAEALPSLAPLLGPAWATLGAELARKARLYLLAGTTLVVDADGQLRHRAYLFGPDGAPLGWQDQTHPGPREQALGVVPAEVVEPIATPLGRLGIVVADDVLVPEVAAILALQGAQTLLHPTATTSFSGPDWQRRLWREAQALQLFGVEAPLIGQLLGERFAGRATVHAPCELTREQRGVLAQAADEQEEAVVLGALDERRRAALLERSELATSRNQAFYQAMQRAE